MLLAGGPPSGNHWSRATVLNLRCRVESPREILGIPMPKSHFTPIKSESLWVGPSVWPLSGFPDDSNVQSMYFSGEEIKTTLLVAG